MSKQAERCRRMRPSGEWPELGEPNVRELLIGNYRLIFEVQEKTVYILGLIHGARDLAALWRLEGRSESDKPS
jgi:mRNA-degrading endonuclease RelE of RelBE toxin-antitoxin system